MNDDKKREKNKTVVNEHFWFTAITLGFNAFIIDKWKELGVSDTVIMVVATIINLYAIYLILHRAAAHADVLTKPEDLKGKTESEKSIGDSLREGWCNLKSAFQIIPKVLVSFGGALFYILLVVTSFVGIFYVNLNFSFYNNLIQPFSSIPVSYQNLALNALVSILASFLVLLIIYFIVRPKLEISDFIASHNQNSNFQPDWVYDFKIVNRSVVPLINIRVKLFKITKDPAGDHLVKNHEELPLEKDEVFKLEQYKATTQQENFGWRFTTQRNLNEILEKNEEASENNKIELKFQVIAQHAFSNLTRTFEKSFKHPSSIRENKKHEYGNSLRVITVNPEENNTKG